MSEQTTLVVAGESPYEVVVGRDLGGRLAGLLGPGVRRVAVVHPASRPQDAERLAAVIAASGASPLLVPVPEGEDAKSAAIAAQCWEFLGAAGFTRSDVVVGVGGGATTDLAGFVAATWLRGVRFISVPTTLLGMVDAAVGGKTGINTSAGKNLVGSFHEPAGVLCDLDSLSTLPREDVAAGLAEVVKVGFTTDPVILDLVERDPAEALDPTGDVLPELVVRAIAVKAAVVADDLRESGSGGLGREVLNYGHTFGHAVERLENYRWKHGHAVSVGMMYVAELARRDGRLAPAVADRHREILSVLGLPTTYAAGRFAELLDGMRVDKKARGDLLRFVVLDDIGVPGLLEGPSIELLEAAYSAISKEA